MKRAETSLSSAVLLLSLWALAPGAAPAENRALLVGIGYYEVDGSELPGVDQDIRMMREVALKLGYGPSQIKILSHSEATLERIVGEIEAWLIDGTTPRDRALYYHSGHGTVVDDEDDDEDDGIDEALLPYDFTAGLAGKNGTKPTRVLLDDDLGRLLAEIPAREVVALVDSCHSGTVTRGITRRKKKFYAYDGMPGGTPGSMADIGSGGSESVILLSAAEPDQEAQTSRHGALFTQGIHESVRRAEPAKRLTLEQLRDETADYIRQAVGLRHKLRHTPTFDGNLKLARLNLFLPDPWTGVDVAAAAPHAPPLSPLDPEAPLAPAFQIETPAEAGPAEAREALWDDLELLVSEAGEDLPVHVSRQTYREGESLEISVVAPFDGYLHVLNVGAGEDDLVLLYPNRYQPLNRVWKGETVRVPEIGRFRLPARLPAGRDRQENLVAVVYTTRPLNLYDQPATPEEAFRILRGSEIRSTLRSFRPAPAEAAYSAGRVVVTIEK